MGVSGLGSLMMFKILREGGGGFLVRNCLVNEVEFVGEIMYAESVWMKARGERERSALYIGCVCMPTDGSGIATIDDSYNLRKMSLLSSRRGRLFCLEILMVG